MYILVAGGGKVGANFARTLLQDGKHEVTLIEQRRDRFERLEHEFEHQVCPETRPRSTCSSGPGSRARRTSSRR